MKLGVVLCLGMTFSNNDNDKYYFQEEAGAVVVDGLTVVDGVGEEDGEEEEEEETGGGRSRGSGIIFVRKGYREIVVYELMSKVLYFSNMFIL